MVCAYVCIIVYVQYVCGKCSVAVCIMKVCLFVLNCCRRVCVYLVEYFIGVCYVRPCALLAVADTLRFQLIRWGVCCPCGN